MLSTGPTKPCGSEPKFHPQAWNWPTVLEACLGGFIGAGSTIFVSRQAWNASSPWLALDLDDRTSLTLSTVPARFIFHLPQLRRFACRICASPAVIHGLNVLV